MAKSKAGRSSEAVRNIDDQAADTMELQGTEFQGRASQKWHMAQRYQGERRIKKIFNTVVRRLTTS